MRSTIPVLLIALSGLSGCVEMAGLPGGPDATVAEQCQGRAMRLLKLDRESVVVADTLSFPEGDLVTLDIAGQGRIRCRADVDGNLGDLVWISGGPRAEPIAPVEDTPAPG